MKIKTVFSCLLALLIYTSSLCQTNIKSKLIGLWEAKDTEGVTGSLNFIDSSSIIVTIPDQPLPKGNYEIDETKDPIWFDITIKQGNRVLKMVGLIKLVNDTTLKWQYFDDGVRSNTFNKENSSNTIILKKKE